MKKLYCVLISVSILLGSCAKDTHYLDAGADTGGNAGGGTSTAALEGTKWKMTSLIFGQEINGQKNEQDFFPLADDCSKDDLMIFNKDNIFIYDAGATKCESSEPQQENGRWTLSGDKKKLTLTSESINNTTDPIIYDIVVTSTKLTLTYKEKVTVTTGGQDVVTTIYTIFSFAPHN